MSMELSQAPERFEILDFDSLRAPSGSWRVKGLWPRVGLCFVGGPSQSGKSFWLLNAVASIALGEPVAGCPSHRSGVLYVAAEGASGAKRRIEGLRQALGELGGLCKFIGRAIDLTRAGDVAGLRAAVCSAQADIGARGAELGVVVIDTLSAATPGVDENLSGELGRVLHALQSIAHDFGVLVLVAAHTGKDPSRGLRGWSGQFANADGVIMLDPPAAGLHSGELAKVKDGASGRRFAFRLREIVLGVDDDGEAVTTCVVEECEAQARGEARVSTAVGQDGQIVLTALRSLAGGGAPVLRDRLRGAAFDAGLGGPDPGPDPDARRKWGRRRNKAFTRALEGLASRRVIRFEDLSGGVAVHEAAGA